MSNIECGTLILNTVDLGSIAIPSNIGYSNASLTQNTWTNVNLRDVIGDSMYRKYDTFNIILIENIQTVMPSTTTFPTANDKICLIYMGGLNFINNTYSAVGKNQTGQACIGFLQASAMSSTVGIAQQYFNNYNTFTKNSQTVDLTITYRRVSDGLTAQTTVSTFPEQSFIFKIYGIPKE